MLKFENRADERVLQEIDEQINAGNFEFVFKDGKYLFVEIER